MLRIMLILALAGAAPAVLALDGRSVGPLEGGTQLYSRSGKNEYIAQVLFKRVRETPRIDFEKGNVALSPAKAATIAEVVLEVHFPAFQNGHVEEVTLNTCKLDDGQHGFYTVIFQCGERLNQQTFRIPVLLDGEAVIPVSSSK